MHIVCLTPHLVYCLIGGGLGLSVSKNYAFFMKMCVLAIIWIFEAIFMRYQIKIPPSNPLKLVPLYN